MRSLTLRQKLKLLAVAAASGCVVNMSAAREVLRPHLFPELLPPDSASHDRSFNYMQFLPEEEDPGRVACEQGHPHLVPWMVQHGCPLAPHATLQAAARHCDLDTLRSLWDLLRPLPGAPEHLDQQVLEAAAASATRDTLIKVEWVLGEGAGSCSLTPSVAAAAIEGAGQASGQGADTFQAVRSRLEWLQDRGCPLERAEVFAAALQLSGAASLEVAA